MRYGASIGTGMGLVLVLASLAGPQDPASLQRSLDETVRALAVLTGLEKDLGTKDAVAPERAIEIAKTSSEPAFGDERARDEALQALRRDVGRLQMTHDELLHDASTSPATGATSVHATDAAALLAP